MFSQAQNDRYFTGQTGAADASVIRIFMRQVFSWMTLAMIVTAVTAYWFASSPDLMMSLFNFQTEKMTVLGWIVTLAPIGFVLLMSFGFQRLSPAILTLLFVTFAVLMGMSLSSFILMVYTAASVFKTFLVTSVMFGVMAITGYTTKTDLTKFGSIMMMGLIGIMIAMLINIFLQSGTMDYIISILGVLIFTGLTAYDVQRLKNMAGGMGEYGDANTRKLSIMGALTLYLDFINLFIFLLRFLGDRK
jgi:FtsH-binding integral membrane protein